MSGTLQKKKNHERGPVAPTTKMKKATSRSRASMPEPAVLPENNECPENGLLQIQPVLPGVEIVDLTCDASEAPVVDLTNNDSVMVVEEVPQNAAPSPAPESYVVSSDEEDMSFVSYTPTPITGVPRSTRGLISCPICLDLYSEIVDSGRLTVSTKCGHVFCSPCLRDALATLQRCPTCRTKLTKNQYHPLYI